MARHHSILRAILVNSTLPSTLSDVTLHHKADNGFGSTPLHCACGGGHLSIAQYLISEAHCNPSCVDNIGSTPLHYACHNGHLSIAQYLISETHYNPSCVSYDGWTPLHYVCHSGHINIVQYLIREAHCNPSCVTNDGSTPLHYVCHSGHINIVQYLIREEHCNPSCRNYTLHNTPLHYACIFHHAHIVKYLLSTGRVNPLAENKTGRTAMYYAKSFEIIKLFQPFEECRTAYPVHTFTKLIRQSHTAELVKLAQFTELDRPPSWTQRSTARECAADVQCCTSGIVQHHISE